MMPNRAVPIGMPPAMTEPTSSTLTASASQMLSFPSTPSAPRTIILDSSDRSPPWRAISTATSVLALVGAGRVHAFADSGVGHAAVPLTAVLAGSNGSVTHRTLGP